MGERTTTDAQTPHNRIGYNCVCVRVCKLIRVHFISRGYNIFGSNITQNVIAHPGQPNTMRVNLKALTLERTIVLLQGRNCENEPIIDPEGVADIGVLANSFGVTGEPGRDRDLASLEELSCNSNKHCSTCTLRYAPEHKQLLKCTNQ